MLKLFKRLDRVYMYYQSWDCILVEYASTSPSDFVGHTTSPIQRVV